MDYTSTLATTYQEAGPMRNSQGNPSLSCPSVPSSSSSSSLLLWTLFLHITYAFATPRWKKNSAGVKQMPSTGGVFAGTQGPQQGWPAGSICRAGMPLLGAGRGHGHCRGRCWLNVPIVSILSCLDSQGHRCCGVCRGEHILPLHESQWVTLAFLAGTSLHLFQGVLLHWKDLRSQLVAVTSPGTLPFPLVKGFLPDLCQWSVAVSVVLSSTALLVPCTNITGPYTSVRQSYVGVCVSWLPGHLATPLPLGLHCKSQQVRIHIVQ